MAEFKWMKTESGDYEADAFTIVKAGKSWKITHEGKVYAFATLKDAKAYAENELAKPVANEPEAPVVDDLATILSDLDVYIAERNACTEFNEWKKIKDIDKKIADKVTAYNAKAEAECFNVLKVADNPMLEAAKMLHYEGIRVTERKDSESGGTETVREKAIRAIDPYSLHKKTDGGIGVDKTWDTSCQALNAILTVRRAVELGIPTDGIVASYKMSDEALTIVNAFLDDDDPTKLDKNAFDVFLKGKVQNLVDKMTGVGTVSEFMVNYILAIYSKKNTKLDLTVACANHKAFRQYMLDVCNACATGNDFALSYKAKKQK